MNFANQLGSLLTPEGLIALLTLTVLEVVLGIDNIIFISILVNRLPETQAAKARTIGLSLALILRIAFLFTATWIAGLVHPLFTVWDFGVTGRDLVMLGGGFFLLAKATTELHSKLEGVDQDPSAKGGMSPFGLMIIQIIILDLVFSIDSVITAIGLSQNLLIMIIAVVVAVGVMQFSAGAIARFINKHPTIKVLALAFLMMVGLVLLIEGFHVHVPKGYVYVAMAFSMAVEFLNLRMRAKAAAKSRPVELRNQPYDGQ